MKEQNNVFTATDQDLVFDVKEDRIKKLKDEEQYDNFICTLCDSLRSLEKDDVNVNVIIKDMTVDVITSDATPVNVDAIKSTVIDCLTDLSYDTLEEMALLSSLSNEEISSIVERSVVMYPFQNPNNGYRIILQ